MRCVHDLLHARARQLAVIKACVSKVVPVPRSRHEAEASLAIHRRVSLCFILHVGCMHELHAWPSVSLTAVHCTHDIVA